MLTAGYMMWGSNLRPEWRDEETTYINKQGDVAPLDAPNVYPAGSHIWHECRSGGGFPLPEGVLRG